MLTLQKRAKKSSTSNVEGFLRIGVKIRRHDDFYSMSNDGRWRAACEVGKIHELLRKGCNVVERESQSSRHHEDE